MIILEGLDGVGKSTIVEHLKQFGFSNLHYDYDSANNDLIKKYSSISNRTDLNNLIADRSFFSEMVYGTVLRGGSRISDEQFVDLLKLYASLNVKVIYLTSDKEVLLKRRQEDKKDYDMLNSKYMGLNDKYGQIMNLAAKYLPVLHIDTSEKSMEQTFKQCEDFVFGGRIDERTL